MSLEACAELVQRADPDRFAAAMAAPASARAVLFPVYAFNVEVSRAPWVTEEPMIAEMRLQWWRDALEEIRTGGTVRRHEVVTPLADVLDPEGARLLDLLVQARRWDIYRDPFEDAAHFGDYIDRTAAGLMWVSARALGEARETVVRDYGFAAGVAAWLRAIPDLEARGRVPLVEGTPEAVRALAKEGLDRLKTAQSQRGAVDAAARAALLPGWQARAVLTQAVKTPGRVAEGTLGTSGFARSFGLMWQAGTGRF